MRPWFALPQRAVEAVRATEATAEQVVATGSWPGWTGRDPIDGDTGYRLAGSAGREVPRWTREKAAAYSVAAYRSNPMCRAIVDTYTSFCVGDKGVTFTATNPAVHDVVDEFWTDPANRVADIQALYLRSLILLGEQLLELMVGEQSGVVRFSPTEPTNILDITLRSGNPMWPDRVLLPDDVSWKVAQVDDATGLRDGQALFWAPWKALNTDRRGMPFLSGVLDWIDNYDMVLSNLIDRTALARYAMFDVTIDSGGNVDTAQQRIDEFIRQRGGRSAPPSGSIEVHSEAVKWGVVTATTGAQEDTIANQAVLTSVAAGSGLAKTWLAEPEGANRATSLTMAEPVRRRVGGVQNDWLGCVTELVRFAVDRAVASKRLDRTVTARNPRTGEEMQIPAAQCVTITGPEIAAADSQITAQVLLNLSTGLEKLVQIQALTPQAAQVAAKKAWEDYVGVPYQADLGTPDANPDDVATHVDATKQPSRPQLVAVGK